MTTIPRIGAHAGWHLEFREVSRRMAIADKDFKNDRVTTLSSSDYYGSIEATLPGTLDGGSYTFVIEGTSGEDYARLYKVRKNLVVNLHLYWRDAGPVGYFVDLAGLSDTLHGDQPPDDSLVAVLRVTSLKRRAGTRRYEVVIEARELVYDRLLDPIPEKGSEADSLRAAERIATLLLEAGVRPKGTLPVPSEAEQPGMERSWAKGDLGVERLRELETAMVRQTGKFGLGMYLIRNGILYMGPGRLTEFAAPFPLGAEDGLLQIEPGHQESEDPDSPDADKRDTFELTLRGRPDIGPGNFVEFTRPADETDELGSAVSFALDAPEVFEATKTRLYVRGVTHRLSRENGFVTQLRGVSVPAGKEGWFEHAPRKGPATPEPAPHNDSSEGALAGVLRNFAASGGGQRIDVAQVRATNETGGGLPTQTERLRRGLVADDGRPYAAARLAFDDEESLFESAPYASPFAWGRFGLVLPRYPGMRVLVAHRLGDPDDIVDVGALWERGQAPASRPGDYWLILPAAIDEGDREQVAEDQKPKEPGGKATNDLIDADGNRVIEVGSLTVRVGADRLESAGIRPTAEDGPVHIEHTGSGSRIVIDQDGNITIQAKKALHITAEEDITLDSKKKVVVKVGEIMDVKAR